MAHGCQAGMQQEACDKVYRDRIQRGREAYSTTKLGAFGADLGAVACVFEQPWSRVSSALTEAAQAWLLNDSAVTLMALGRLTEALEPMRAGLPIELKREDWKNTASRVSNLSELELTLGEMVDAVRDAEQSVTYADRSGDAFLRSGVRTTHANALHQAGRRAEAEARFREAEAVQIERQPDYPFLYSVAGFRYCDLLLAAPEAAAWQLMQKSEVRSQRSELENVCRAVIQRAAQALKIAEDNDWLLDIALDHLTLGRAALYAAILTGSSLDPCYSSLQQAVDGLRRAGQQDDLPRGLLTRAWCSFAEASFFAEATKDRLKHRLLNQQKQAADCEASAQRDLDEAWEIAERGPMLLFLADIHLNRARLFHAVKPYPWESPHADLAEARRLIEKHGYWRRKEEREDAEKAIGVG